MDIWGSGPNRLFIVGDEETLLHFDGQQWQQLPMPGLKGLRAVSGRHPQDVYAVGADRVLHFDGHSWQTKAQRLPCALTAIALGKNDTALATSACGKVLYHDGKKWVLVDSPTAYPLLAVEATAEGGFLLAGEGGTLLGLQPMASPSSLR
jgi:photosystem II stability/assembly factor-like uncharacterized protein